MTKHSRAPISLSTLSAVMIIAASIILRLILISQNMPSTMSDESVMDLMAKHIAYDGAHPIFFYGQSYMGALEAYLGAFCMLILGGPSVFAVRFGLIVINALALLCMYLLTRLLYTKSLALFTITLLALGTSDIFGRELLAIGGYPELFFFGALILLLASKLALTAPSTTEQRAQLPARQRWTRLGLYAALGLSAGLALYADQLSIAFALPALLLLLWSCRRELLSLPVLCGILMFVIGLVPMVYYNIKIIGTPTHSTFQDLANISQSQAVQMVSLHLTTLQKVSGTIFISLPSITGFNPLCDTIAFPGFSTAATFSQSCTLRQGAWSLGFFILLFASLLLAGSQILRLIKKGHKLTQQDSLAAEAKTAMEMEQSSERQQIIRNVARLMLLLSALITLLIYVSSPSPAVKPDTNSRYLLGLLVATPALLWPLWNGFSQDKPAAFRGPIPTVILRLASLALILGIFINGTIGFFRDIPAAQATYAKQERLINDLLSIGATRIYTDYWTGYVLAAQSNEKIQSVSLDGNLFIASATNNRYPPYKQALKSATRPAYVFDPKSSAAQNIERMLPKLKTQYEKHYFEGYVVYQFDRPVPIPR